MAQVVQARCPGCKKVLRIPSEWLQQVMKCKHCGATFNARGKQPAAASAPAPAAAPAAPEQVFTPRRPAPAPEPAPAPAPLSAAATPGSLGDLNFDALQDEAPIVRPHARRSRGSSLVRMAVGVVVLALLGAGGVVVYQQVKDRGLLGGSASATIVDPDRQGESSGGGSDLLKTAGSGPFPRRALAICVSNYLYANPVGYGDGDQDFHAVVDRLVKSWRIPADQVVELSDGVPTRVPEEEEAPGKKGRRKEAPAPSKTTALAISQAPLRPVIEKAVTDFLDGCRGQDRIVLLFVGHATEVDDEPYLVPLEGDLADKTTLIPLRWLYDRLGQCKARQKLLLLDVCRYNPERGNERPGGGPMGPKLDEALQKPPAGVQVWSACVEGQQSFEFGHNDNGVFLSSLAKALKQTGGKGIQKPHDALPLDGLVEAVRKLTEEDVASLGAQQTPRLTGQEPAEGEPYRPDEPAPPRVLVQMPAPPGGTAPPVFVKAILDEIDFPPLRDKQKKVSAFNLETLLSFPAKVQEEYRPDYNSFAQLKEEISAKKDEYALRAAVLDALEFLRNDAKNIQLQETFSGGNSETIKSEILKDQRAPARLLGELMELEEKLRKAGEARDSEKSKRWQAHYDYVLAQVLARIAYIHEYNLMLGKIRKDELPELEKQHVGYRLSSREKLQSGKEIRDMAAESRKILNHLAKEHAGTPWEVLARRDRLIALGLEWQPVRGQ